MYWTILTIIFPLLLFTSEALQFPKLWQEILSLELRTSSRANLTVPGDSPARHCEEPTEDLFTFDYVRVKPNPPETGFYCFVEAVGTFKKEPGKGAQLKINGTYNGNDSEYFVAPLCEFVSVVQDRIPQCPPKKGNATISYVFGIYDFYDDGNYTVRVEALTEDKRRLFCLLATVIWKS